MRGDDPTHPPAAAARRRLHQEREADGRTCGEHRRQLVRAVDGGRLQRARDVRDADAAGQAPGGQLVTQRRDRG